MRLRDVSEREVGPWVELTPADLDAFFEAHAAGPVRMWDGSGEGFGIRFALGDGRAAGLMVTGSEGDSDEPFWVLVEGTGPALQAREAGSPMELPGREALSITRLKVILLALLRTGERPKGAWEREPPLGAGSVDDLLAEVEALLGEPVSE